MRSGYLDIHNDTPQTVLYHQAAHQQFKGKLI